MSSTFDRRPHPDEYFAYYQTYVSKVPDGSVLDTLRAQAEHARQVYQAIPKDREQFRYAPGKWSIRELVCHVADTEREFGTRAMRFARGDEHALPSFDQDQMIAGADLTTRSLNSLATECAALRQANVALFESFSDEVLGRTGIASGYRFSVRSILFIIAGHEKHHLDVLQARYL